MAAKKKMNSKDQTKKNERRQLASEEESLKRIFDLALLKAKKITEKYDLKKAESNNSLIPKN